MKTIALISTMIALPAASLLAQGQSEIDALRSRIDSHERRISLLERELSRLRGSSVAERPARQAASAAGEYVVVKGDVLARIARRHHTTVAAIKRANGLKNDNISIGQKLRIPGASASAAKHPRAQVVADSKPAASGGKHKVKRGETFYSIARQHKMSVKTLMAANPDVKPTSLRPGQTLSIQPASRAVASNKRAASKPKPKSKKLATRKSERVDAPKPAKEVARKAPAKKSPEPAIRTITVHKQMTYGQFASKYGASTSQLNALNGLSLNKSTMLAKGSELYVPQF